MEVLRPPLEELAQVQRITEHHLFRGADSICRLLRFLVEHAVNARSEPVREFDIATEVFKRRQDFDPQSDSIVRVQVGRLRTRLTRYYFEAGTSDPIVFEVPRGGYSLAVSYRERPLAREQAPVVAPAPAVPIAPVALTPKRTSRAIALLISAGLAVALLAVVMLRRPAVPAPLVKFWEPFTSVPLPPFVIYSNQVRVAPVPAGTVSHDSSDLNRPLYTGIGEVMGAVALTHLFDRLGHGIVFRGEFLTPWEDLKNSNLIFVGTATQSLKAVGNPERFTLRHYIPDDLSTPLVIVDLKPEKDHPAFFGRTTTSPRPPDEEYALLMLSPAVVPGRVALTMFGTSTLGTQAAVEFVCDPNSVAALLKFMTPESGTVPTFFEAVLRVRVRDNAPIASDIAAFYQRKHS
jgi:hypothetical protein